MRPFSVIASASLLSVGFAASRQEQYAAIMKQINDSQYLALPSYKGRDVTSMRNLFKFALQGMSNIFDNESDERPAGQDKLQYPLGIVAGAKFVPTQHGYTGLFDGADSCVLRLSLAADPAKVDFAPALALKCLRDNATSGNLLALAGANGQGSTLDFFAQPLSNRVGAPTTILGRVISKVYSRASSCPGWVSLRNFAAVGQDGVAVESPLWPGQVYLVPQLKLPLDAGQDFRTALQVLGAGSTLWSVESRDGDERETIGSIQTTTEFSASAYADTTMFFRHERGEVDHC